MVAVSPVVAFQAEVSRVVSGASAVAVLEAPAEALVEGVVLAELEVALAVVVPVGAVASAEELVAPVAAALAVEPRVVLKVAMALPKVAVEMVTLVVVQAVWALRRAVVATQAVLALAQFQEMVALETSAVRGQIRAMRVQINEMALRERGVETEIEIEEAPTRAVALTRAVAQEALTRAVAQEAPIKTEAPIRKQLAGTRKQQEATLPAKMRTATLPAQMRTVTPKQLAEVVRCPILQQF